jgi:DNA modification methylase
MVKETTLYNILEVKPTATKEEILKNANLFVNSPENFNIDFLSQKWQGNSIEISETTEEEMKLIDFITQIEETKYSTNGVEGYAHKIRRIHPSPKPPQLMKKLIEFFTKPYARLSIFISVIHLDKTENGLPNVNLSWS